VETTFRDAVAFPQAMQTCGRAGRRVLTSAEIVAVAEHFEAAVSINVRDSEWSGTGVSPTHAMTAGMMDNGTDNGRTTTQAEFHCMTVPAITAMS
jgi:hypothetical protein